MLVQKLHDDTLAPLSVLKKIKMASKMVAINNNKSAPTIITIALCLKCSFYAVNINKMIVLSFDPHIIVMRQDGGQDGCHNHNKRGVFSIKRQSTAA